MHSGFFSIDNTIIILFFAIVSGAFPLKVTTSRQCLSKNSFPEGEFVINSCDDGVELVSKKITVCCMS